MRNAIIIIATLTLVGCAESPSEPTNTCHEVTETVTSRINAEGDPIGLSARRLNFLTDVIGAECERVDTDIRQFFDAGLLYTNLVGTWECTRCGRSQ